MAKYPINRYSDTKFCTKCEKEKDKSDFYNRSDKPHLLQSHCKICIRKKTDENIAKDIEKKKLRDRIYSKNNKDKKRAFMIKWMQRTVSDRNKKYKDRYLSDIDFRITQNLRNRVRMAIRRNSKSKPTLELIGCNIEFLKNYISNLFTEGMSWDNYGEWQIDHIYPCAKFDLSVIENQKKCFHYSNLQPLWKLDNLIKKDKVIEKEVCYR